MYYYTGDPRLDDRSDIEVVKNTKILGCENHIEVVKKKIVSRKYSMGYERYDFCNSLCFIF